jgi:hypothetical protein
VPFVAGVVGSTEGETAGLSQSHSLPPARTHYSYYTRLASFGKRSATDRG